MPVKAKEFFRQVRVAESELKIINAKLRHYEEIGLNISNPIGSIGSGQKGRSRVELAAIGAVDASRDLLDQKKAYLALIGRAERVIKMIPQEKYREILNYRYMIGKSFAWISDELDYTDRNSIYRAHGWALAAAQKILNGMRFPDEKGEDNETS